MGNLLWSEIEKKYQFKENHSSEMVDLLHQEIDKDNSKLVILDDDPTGVQTVHGVYVYTDWSYESILEGFRSKEKLFYILTNSRALTQEQTEQLHREIAQNIIRAAGEAQINFQIISRGDSTLRGHYPLETDVLKEELERGLGVKMDGEILIPYFKAGGRYTINNIHYVKYKDELVPAADTEFARDKTFGYANSNLCEYIEEKTKGKYAADEVTTISLEELRDRQIEVIKEKLCSVTDFGKVIVNAIDQRDLEIFCVALYLAIREGKRFLYRSAAEFVKIIAGISDQNLLKKEDMLPGQVKQGGLVVIGSHTEKTTAQLKELEGLEKLVFLEFDSDLVLEDRLTEEVERVNKISKSLIEQGKTVVIYTKRRLLTLENDTKEKALLRSVKISESVQRLVSEVGTVPAFVIAKGGITSSDIGVKALKVRKAYVLGQIQPGIPVWKTDQASRFPELPYVIFPGNVGEADTLKRIICELI
ncbi:MAG: hydroxyacid dehydrogenase [Herbinix sp.]|jgi:uncharacterized protein YgbK (DUF1537 family)|nr:hydroxyacid dehydrogenase [Herbinix sp.]